MSKDQEPIKLKVMLAYENMARREGSGQNYKSA